MQYRTQCICADEYPHGVKQNDSACDFECPGDSSAMCGGNWMMSVYKANIVMIPSIATTTMSNTSTTNNLTTPTMRITSTTTTTTSTTTATITMTTTTTTSSVKTTRQGYSGIHTERFFHCVARFCPGFQYNLRGPAWAVGSCSISLPAEGTFQDVIFQTLGRIAVVQHFSGSAMRHKILRLIPSPDMDIWTSLMPKNVTVEYTYETQHWSSMSGACKCEQTFLDTDIWTFVR